MSLTDLMRKYLLTREGFLAAFVGLVGGLAGLVVAIPIIGYVLSPLIEAEPDVWRNVGPASKYTIGDTVEVPFQSDAPLQWAGTTAKQAVWLRRNSTDSFTAYAIYCTHLGCPIHWLPDAKIFLCPCHGSVFTANGQVAGGPAPRPLFQYEVRVKNGNVWIKTHSLPVVT
jgi:menaquinol-cytochrome c reductase iron-sulfur subunit